MKPLLYGVLLGAVITLTAQSFISYSYAVPDPPPENRACDNEHRYPDPPENGGGLQIYKSTRDKWVENWSKDTIRINYAYISKIAIDSIFARNLTDNCLKIESALDDKGKPSLIISGEAKPEYVVDFLEELNLVTFISTESTCPHSCD